MIFTSWSFDNFHFFSFTELSQYLNYTFLYFPINQSPSVLCANKRQLPDISQVIIHPDQGYVYCSYRYHQNHVLNIVLRLIYSKKVLCRPNENCLYSLKRQPLFGTSPSKNKNLEIVYISKVL